MKEIWKDIKGYEGHYQISNYGRVKSLARKYRPNEIIMNLSLNPYGYPITTLNKIGLGMNTFLVHRLVVQHFINNCDLSLQVNHKDMNKQNNRIDNLEMVTCKENNAHAIANGVQTRPIGEKNGKTKLSEKDVSLIFFYRQQGLTQSNIADMFNISQSSVSMILKGKRWKYMPLAQEIK